MKKHLHCLIKRIVICIAIMAPAITAAQINYTQNFNSGLGTWSDDYFGETDIVPCSGAGAALFNLYFDEPYADMISPSIGVSNGGEITITYQYKLLNYDLPEPTEPTENSEEWGVIGIYYATSPTGPWTLVQSITPDNHVESATCATKTASFFAPAGSNVYVAVAAELDSFFSDFFVFFDEFTAVQAAPVTCSGAPAASNTVTSAATVCNTQQITLSLSTAYTNLGISYLWQSSTDGVAYTDLAGTSSTFTTTQAATRWYRAKISCGTDFVYSAPVQVVSSGVPCLCGIDFDPEAAIEPITQVTFAGINNTTSPTVNGTPGVQNFTNLTPGQVVQGQSYPISLKGNTDGNYDDYFTVYFDWNHDGDLTDAGEAYPIGFITASTGVDAIVLNGTIAVPPTAMPGLTNMRVLKLFDEYPDSPCSSEIGLGFGQAEDYLVNVLPAPTFDWVNVQHPPTMTLNVGETGVVYAQGYEPGVTEAAGAGAGVTAWIGISGNNTDPSGWTTWIPATFNVQAGNNDEFMATIGAGLEPGIYYYASRFQLNGINYVYGGINGIWNAATSGSGVLTVNCDTEAPDADETQSACAGSTLSDLEAEGDEIIWYTSAIGGTPLPMSTVLTEGGIYFAAQVPDDGCESIARTQVTVDLVVTDPPQALLIDQIFCNSATIGDIQVGAQGEVVWYASATSTTPLSDDFVITSMTPYYAAQIVDGCESQQRTDVAVQVIITPAPTGDSTQEFSSQATLADIDVAATGTVNYYASQEDAENGEDALSPQDIIPAGTTTYYITQTANTCESVPFAVTVDVTLGAEAFSGGSFTYYPNPVNNVLNLSYTGEISSIEVYNLVGQQILMQTIGNSEAQINMERFSSGTYMIKVISGESSKTFKVVKN